jgi:hypothetical protein
MDVIEKSLSMMKYFKDTRLDEVRNLLSSVNVSLIDPADLKGERTAVEVYIFEKIIKEVIYCKLFSNMIKHIAVTIKFFKINFLCV